METMGSIGLLKWRKAYMLEFLDGTDVKEVFTFSVPPESEEFVFSQRITERHSAAPYSTTTETTHTKLPYPAQRLTKIKS